MNKTATRVSVEDIMVAHHTLKDVVYKTPLERNRILSERLGCNVYIKREDLQVVRSFKLRGAYHLIRSLSEEEVERGVVCASAGNHAQGVAYSCHTLGIRGVIFMPATTPRQKVSQVKRFGGDAVEVVLVGDTFDDSFAEATKYTEEHGMTFVHPFDDPKIIAGQGTVGMEIMDEIADDIDYVFVGIGGGGLAAGVGTYMKSISPSTKIIGVEPEGAPCMKQALAQNKPVTLANIDKFVDGAAVKQAGALTMDICGQVLDDIVLVPEGKVCTTILNLYNQNAIVAEPAGALSIAALDLYKEQIQGKNVVCVISGGNNDIDRMQEIKERSLIYEGLKHYFIINFPQRAGALREFLDNVLGPNDDITRFEYTKKNNKDNGPALVGIELKKPEDYLPLTERLRQSNIDYMEINNNPSLFNLLI
ncbi:threonine ammonia-lyase IlvA [Aneurinibacillus aneurinilyticus]|jgi:threonine dehydratase|uniref:L-threonine dehydratase n=2 Tax=Aneurinibacillus aneurinilyticus TaxID=1391 RepID=A0A848CZG8_ANEAE|nr:threonine ammonia-lyase IlvA [Aneurinibacillus aneurinilyticus]ERI11696.1 threonine ammonia-lyase [Aneurinibacillus aneurinilyticus ATCC 12856]MCI1695891.1 threonine ammonia-lyase IlvA [Aneurinibacillus aneurinilyticus]MED0668626.1 threonine ammonia-lyase IlvA [Aneurinibacillus aneurinilyticus]MED0708845.1 threonine ammonia-lyase IlvA [Aneurinibacillus aneurinilyticus]MED0725350.1 threonine ammonia-lyase IlvA [Aneurinibacillus aneurinilyticus]